MTNTTIGQYHQPIFSMAAAVDELYNEDSELMSEKEITALRFAY